MNDIVEGGFCVLEKIIKRLRGSEIRHDGKFHAALPRRVSPEDIVGLLLRPNRGRDGISALAAGE